MRQHMDTVTDEISREASRIEEDALYSARGHFVAARIWGSAHLWLGIPASVLAAIAGTSALAQFDNHNILAGLLSLIVVALTAIATFLNPNEKAHTHLTAGNHYNALRNQARIFRGIDVALGGERDELAKHLGELSRQRDELNERSPQVPRWAFTRARTGIEEGEAHYAVDSPSTGQPAAPQEITESDGA